MAGVMLLVSVISICFAAEPSQKVFRWQAVCNEPEADTRVIYHKEFRDNVRKMSSGRLDITLYPGASLYPPFDWFKNTGKGVNEVALAYGAYLGGVNPALGSGISTRKN
jgi:TRAP-type C4-dicarboxylate transport system substrate-binding protein